MKWKVGFKGWGKVMRNICFICLKTENCLLKVVGDDENYQDLEILEKLRNCVPEVVSSKNGICVSKSVAIVKIMYKFVQAVDKVFEYDDLDSKREVETDEIDLDNDAALIEPDLHEDETLYGCFTCGKDFKIKSNLESHIKQKHEIKQDTKIEENQQKVKTSENEIIPTTDNVKIDETDLKIAPTCTLCGTTFCNKYLLKRHLQNVHAAEKKFKCDTCNSSFVSPVYLNAHKRYHIGDRTHICSFCGKGFITASDLYHHEKIHAK
ncbi:hypothetical protein NQ317_009004 [Molorchus minor]|uniref:C2H2-type domain-containing protein n=1 Tax=Molorchus minor TaxID=1323400 RepID=A0ABQ9JNP2_9CUCU|nr:hypothetical protein NQ317_009004 [Molorchus minor]